MVFSIKYEVSEKDRSKVISGSYEVKSDEDTFRGLAEAVAAIYEQSTNESVTFSQLYLGKSGGKATMHEVPEETLDGSLTYDLMSDVVWVVVKRSEGRSGIVAGHLAPNKADKAVFTVKYEVSKADRQGLIDGVHKVYSDDETFKGLADALVAKYQEATNEHVDFSKLYLVKKGAAAASTFEISKESLNGSLTYDLMSDEVWVVVRAA
ncbi:hypothetical protein KFL_000280140 [Klebsormidium nitens]|uniref:Uncharacterized protein n=1 Tax=Klebsormidium nitens TaxID=105231 RepID=A0A1Y1HQ31_KLENI|nr:hypothetical protein KFL_000280140 [Klebsormidium nitens]|eukprot:GAQ79309.1 hypothetical protein KFL_000280140 [Klebsormidium nitens]